MLESRLSATPITTFFCANDVQHERQLSVQKNVRWAQSQIIAFFFASTGWAIGRHSCNKAVVSVRGSKNGCQSFTPVCSDEKWVSLSQLHHSFTSGWMRAEKIVGTALPSVGRCIKMAANALPNLYVDLKGENGCHSFTKALQQLGAEWAQPNTESPENEKTTQKKSDGAPPPRAQARKIQTQTRSMEVGH